MKNNAEKEALRKILLEKRDGISHDLMKISSKKIQKNLKKIEQFRNAEMIACYYPMGSEVFTQDIIQEALSNGKQVCLPKVVGDDLVFKKIVDFKSLEKGRFDIMEPKDDCPVVDDPQVIVVPAVGISRDGVRLGYGYGFYDRYLSQSSALKIAITFAKQVVKSIPSTEYDIKMDAVVTEEEVFTLGKR